MQATAQGAPIALHGPAFDQFAVMQCQAYKSGSLLMRASNESLADFVTVQAVLSGQKGADDLHSAPAPIPCTIRREGGQSPCNIRREGGHSLLILEGEDDLYLYALSAAARLCVRPEASRAGRHAGTLELLSDVAGKEKLTIELKGQGKGENGAHASDGLHHTGYNSTLGALLLLLLYMYRACRGLAWGDT